MSLMSGGERVVTEERDGPAPGKAKRRLHRWVIGVAIVLGLLYFVGPLMVAPFLRDKLQTMVSSHLNARLAMGRLGYHFPYGVTLHDAALIARDERGQDIDLLRV